MGILIAAKNRNGICMASDSRLTTERNGVGRIEKKIYKTDSFLLGVTAFSGNANNPHGLIREAVQRIISRETDLSADQFLAALYGELKEQSGTAYHFIIGYREKDPLSGSDYVLRYVKLKDGRFERNEKIYHDSILAVRGDFPVAPAVSVDPGWDLQKLGKMSRRMAGNAIGMEELFLNPDMISEDIQSEFLT